MEAKRNNSYPVKAKYSVISGHLSWEYYGKRYFADSDIEIGEDGFARYVWESPRGREFVIKAKIPNTNN